MRKDTLDVGPHDTVYVDYGCPTEGCSGEETRRMPGRCGHAPMLCPRCIGVQMQVVGVYVDRKSEEN